jgi:hypothetical protein
MEANESVMIMYLLPMTCMSGVRASNLSFDGSADQAAGLST